MYAYTHISKELLLIYKKGKSPFLTIQLLPQFGFGHRTSIPDIFDHLTLKTVHN
jgi:hypothetical protein